MARKKQKIIGLDLGQHSIKAVSYTEGDTNPELHYVDLKEEGILDDEEMRSFVSDWLGKIGNQKYPVITAVPQYLATSQVNDFPPNVAAASLDELVAYETRQLGGLSDDSFVHSYSIMPALYGRNNPVLIGVCREAVVKEQTGNMLEAGINLHGLNMAGTAIVDALFKLHPEAREEQAPQLVLEVGCENTTMLVIGGGSVLFVGSLFWGGARVSETMSHLQGCSIEEAERLKKDLTVEPDDYGSPLVECLRQLENELGTAIEHWRDGENAEVANKMFKGIWVCGGGARLKGMAEYLGRSFGCKSQVFGVGEEKNPGMVVAYGLALQGAGEGHYNINFLPAEVHWMRLREKRVPLLITAVFLLALSLVALISHTYVGLTRELNELDRQNQDVEQCERLIPLLEDTEAAIQHHKKMLLPIVEYANRGSKFLTALQVLSDAKGDGDWFIYLADEESYHAEKDEEKSVVKKPKVVQPFGAMIFGGDTPVAEVSNETPSILVDDIKPVNSLIVAGWIPFNKKKTYEPIKSIARNLNDSNIFYNVDSIVESDQADRDDIFKDWFTFFSKNKGKRFKPFVLKMPYNKKKK